MDVIHSLTLPMHTLYSQVQAPVHPRGNQPPDPGGGPLPSWGRGRQTAPVLPRPRPSSRPPAPNPVPNKPHPPPERGLCTKEGSTWPKATRQPEPPQEKVSFINIKQSFKALAVMLRL
ncbi:hypothetical protein AMECASPLE_029168 [Ameca splendens]|uniref:Uncharacterized protein n=1 Tax=Ameca splendens TaxID=208324 RepID=A0ABV1A137_9TELE